MAECVRALREREVALGHRMGARVFGLGARGVRFSLAFLEEAAEGGSARQVLRDPAWRDLAVPEPKQVEGIVAGRAEVVVDNGVIYVVTPEEAGAAPAPERGSLLPAVLGGSPPAPPAGLLWEKRRMEEAALSLLDAEDPGELVESFRYLFRALLACGQDPSGLLVTAFRRQKLELSREAARLVQEHIHRELGRALGDLLSRDPVRLKDALHYLLGEGSERWAGVLEAVILPALTAVVAQGGHRRLIFAALPRLVRVTGGELARVEPFLDAVTEELADLGMEERLALGDYLAALPDRFPGVTGYLLRRLRSTTDPHGMAFYGSVLARCPLTPEERRECVERLVEAFAAHGTDIALQERLRTTFLALGPEPLERLAVHAGLGAGQRVWLVHLWAAYRQAGRELPPEEGFVHFAWGEIVSHRDASLRALARTGQLLQPALVERLLAEPHRRPILDYLTDQAFRMEDPDDGPVLDLLARLGMEAVEPAFERVREEAALESGAAPERMLLLGRLARRVAFSDSELERVREMVWELLHLELFAPRARPSTWLALGELGSVRNLGEELSRTLVERLAGHLSFHPHARVRGLLTMYPATGERVRQRIEGVLRQVLQEEHPDRPLLRACLDGLEELVSAGTGLCQPEPLVMLLCRNVLWKGREESLDSVLRRALREEGEWDGVRVPVPWMKEDRDQALRILGAIARHPRTTHRLHRLLVVRLFSFLQDWIEGVEAGKDLYALRETPLWEILGRLLEERPGEQGMALAREACVRLLELHRRAPHLLALERREQVQRFLLTVTRLCETRTVRVRGVALDLPRAALRTLIEVAAAASSSGETHVSLYLLRREAERGQLPGDLQRELEAFLARTAG